MSMSKPFATAEIAGSYGPEFVPVYANSDSVPRFSAPGWHGMKFEKGRFDMACRKVANHPGFVRFVESAQ